MARWDFGRQLTRCILKRRPSVTWMHKSQNVLNHLPKGVQEKAKEGLKDTWMAGR